MRYRGYGTDINKDDVDGEHWIAKLSLTEQTEFDFVRSYALSEENVNLSSPSGLADTPTARAELLKELYTQEIIQLIQGIQADDIKVFGYSTNLDDAYSVPQLNSTKAESLEKQLTD